MIEMGDRIEMGQIEISGQLIDNGYRIDIVVTGQKELGPGDRYSGGHYIEGDSI